MSEQFTIVRHPPSRWFAWRDLVSILLGVTILILVVQVGQLRHELDKRPTAAQLDVLTRQIDDLTGQLEAKDARIKQLSDLLIRNRIPIPPEPSPPAPHLTPSPSPEPPHPSMARTPSPSRRPSPHPSPAPSPTPHCAALLAGQCLTPPPPPAA